MRCDEVMTRDVVFVEPTDHTQEAARKMRDANIGFLPVCDEHRRVVGALTDRDIVVRLVAEGFAVHTTVREVMSRDVVACRPGDDLAEAERLMGEHRKERIIVTDAGGRLLGVIGLADLVQHASDDRASETLRRVTEREISPS